MPLISHTIHIIAQMDLTSGFGNISFEWNSTHQTLTDHRSKFAKRGKRANVQFRFMPNAFRIRKPIQNSSKHVWVFRKTGANAVAKTQTRLAYEDKRDLYCMQSPLKKTPLLLAESGLIRQLVL